MRDKSDPLVSFIYLLMRDVAPTGLIEKVMDDTRRSRKKIVQYSAPHLRAYAQLIADEIRQVDDGADEEDVFSSAFIPVL